MPFTMRHLIALASGLVFGLGLIEAPDTHARKGLATMPAMPAMRPLPSRNSADAMPINRPPTSDAHGVN